MKTMWAVFSVMPLMLAGCQTKHTIVVEQPKPLEVNINFTGRLDLVIHEAREDVDKITGQKAERVVRPEDIGLPTKPTSAMPEMPLESRAVALLADFGRMPVSPPTATRLATEDELKKSMAERYKDVRAILDAQVAGESYTGLLAERGTLTAAQSAVLAAENADRDALYTQEAARRALTKAEVGLSYYLARLGHAKKGDWYQKYDKAKSEWVWAKWGE